MIRLEEELEGERRRAEEMQRIADELERELEEEARQLEEEMEWEEGKETEQTKYIVQRRWWINCIFYYLHSTSLKQAKGE